MIIKSAFGFLNLQDYLRWGCTTLPMDFMGGQPAFCP